MGSKAKPELEKEIFDLEREILQKEWKECRETIRNFDRTLTMLRISSLAFVATLIGVSTSFFVDEKSPAASLTMFGAIILTLFVYYLERHYRGFLITTVDRGIRLEHRLKEVFKKRGVDLDNLKIRVDCKETSEMISGAIKKRRESYPWYWREAHKLIYVFLEVVNISLFVIFLCVYLLQVLFP